MLAPAELESAWVRAASAAACAEAFPHDPARNATNIAKTAAFGITAGINATLVQCGRRVNDLFALTSETQRQVNPEWNQERKGWSQEYGHPVCDFFLTFADSENCSAVRSGSLSLSPVAFAPVSATAQG